MNQKNSTTYFAIHTILEREPDRQTDRQTSCDTVARVQNLQRVKWTNDRPVRRCRCWSRQLNVSCQMDSALVPMLVWNYCPKGTYPRTSIYLWFDHLRSNHQQSICRRTGRHPVTERNMSNSIDSKLNNWLQPMQHSVWNVDISYLLYIACSIQASKPWAVIQSSPSPACRQEAVKLLKNRSDVTELMKFDNGKSSVYHSVDR